MMGNFVVANHLPAKDFGFSKGVHPGLSNCDFAPEGTRVAAALEQSDMPMYMDPASGMPRVLSFSGEQIVEIIQAVKSQYPQAKVLSVSMDEVCFYHPEDDAVEVTSLMN